jgi:uncharacterized protein (TIGR03086 family)
MTATTTATTTVEPVGDRTVRIVRAFRAPRRLVWDAHTRPDLLKRWLGPADWPLTECEIDLRPGGGLRQVSRGPDGTEMVMRGTYTHVDPPSRLVATIAFDDDWTGGETTNTWIFDEVAGVTTVTLIVDYASPESRDGALATGMAEGMGEGYRRLDALASVLTDVADRYRRRADRFGELVAAVDPATWDAPSPCAEWRARDVVGHIVDMHDVMLGPCQPSPRPSIEEDPPGAYRAARADVETILADPAVALAERDTPMGRMTVAEHVDGVVSIDLVLHGWDLARAAGLDDAIDPDELDRLWPGIEQIPDEMRIPDHFGPGVVVFGPEVAVPPDAPLQDRLLGKLGRDPRWERAEPGQPTV